MNHASGPYVYVCLLYCVFNDCGIIYYVVDYYEPC